MNILFSFPSGCSRAASLRLACCWRINVSSLRKCSSSCRSFAWKRKSISRMTSVVTDLLMSLFNASLLETTTSVSTSPMKERTCSNCVTGTTSAAETSFKVGTFAGTWTETGAEPKLKRKMRKPPFSMRPFSVPLFFEVLVWLILIPE